MTQHVLLYVRTRMRTRAIATLAAASLTCIGLATVTPAASAATLPSVIETIAGTGSYGASGDGGSATNATLETVYDTASSGTELFIATPTRVRRVDAAGTITTVAGTGTFASSGDGGPAVAASICPGDLVHTGTALYVLDTCGDRVRKIEAGVITTVAGGGTIAFPYWVAATTARLQPSAIAYANGRLYIADRWTFAVYVVEPSGLIHDVVTSVCAHGLAVDRAANIIIADCSNSLVTKVRPNGSRVTVAGTGTPGYSGDGGLGSAAQIGVAQGVAVDSLDNVYIADSDNRRIRAVSSAGVITTLVGDGENGYAGDGGPAAAARMSFSYGVDVEPTGAVVLSDSYNYRVRRVGSAVPTSDATGAYPSDDCAAGTVLAAHTYRDIAIRISTLQADSNTRWVCVRADGPSVAAGGRFDISGATVSSPGAPSTDSNADACATTPGNGVPGPHPLLAAAVGDPGDPDTYLPFLLDSYSGNQTAWICVQVGAERHRVIVPVGVGVGSPSIAFVPDVAGSHLPTAAPPPATPSGSCQATGSIPLLFDAVAGPTRLVLYGGPMPMCVRLEGPVTIGGRIDFADNTAGAVPSVTTSTTDMSPCTVQVAGVASPANVQVRRSATGAVPASLCVTVGSDSLRVTVGTGSGGEPASVTWTPDPGTPGLP